MPATTLSKTIMRGPHFTVPVPQLLAALETLKLAASTRPPVPVLGGVLITQGVFGLELATFDYDTSVRVLLDPSPQPDYGRLLVSFAELTRLVKGGIKGESKKEQESLAVRFESEITRGEREVEKPGQPGLKLGEQIKVVEPYQFADITVEVGGFTMPLDSLPIEDYPELPIAHPATFHADAADLLDSWNRVLVAQGADDTLPMLTHQYWELKGGTLTMAGTDRFQLVVANREVRQVGEDVQVLLPRITGKAFKLLSGMVAVGIKDGDSVKTGTRWVSLQAGDITITVSKGDSEFPRFRQLFPPMAEKNASAIVDRAALTKLVAKASAMGSSRVRQVELTLQPAGVKVTPFAPEHQGRVRGAEILAVTAGPEYHFAVDPDKLLEVLGVFTGASVAIGLNSPNRPVVLADTVDDLFGGEPSLRGLVMPVRLPG